MAVDRYRGANEELIRISIAALLVGRQNFGTRPLKLLSFLSRFEHDSDELGTARLVAVCVTSLAQLSISRPACHHDA